MRILTAAHVLPIASDPIARGAVAIDGSRIAAVGTIDELTARFPEAALEDFGEAAIMPGLVNCHSHLEITSLRGSLDDVEHDFRSWLLKLNGLRQEMSDEAIEDAAFRGALEGAEAGVTCFGDIGRYGRAGLLALKRAGLRGILFQETEFSPDERTAEQDLVNLRGKYEALAADATELVEIGLSPHSPYTVSEKLFRLIARLAVESGIKLTIHAAESAEEDELLRNGRGFFTEIYAKFDVKWKVPACSAIEFLQRSGVLEARPLLAHCVTVSELDLEVIRQSGASIAHCPKSNAKFGHGYAPFERFLGEGIPTGLGSDSVASNNACDIIEESRFATLAARNRPGSGRFISPREALAAATIGGAKALGLDGKIGSLEIGKCADIAVISLSRSGQWPVADAESAIVFSSNGRDVLRTIVNGKDVFKS